MCFVVVVVVVVVVFVVLGSVEEFKQIIPPPWYKVGGGGGGGVGVMKLLPRLFAVLLSCKVPSDHDHFLGQKFDIIFCFLFPMSVHPRGLLENPKFSDVTSVQPVFDSEFTTEQRQLDL